MYWSMQCNLFTINLVELIGFSMGLLNASTFLEPILEGSLFQTKSLPLVNLTFQVHEMGNFTNCFGRKCSLGLSVKFVEVTWILLLDLGTV